jgi:hypothetical protein
MVHARSVRPAASFLGCPASTPSSRDFLTVAVSGFLDPMMISTIRTVDLDGVPDGYRAMTDREALKVMIRP